MIMSGLQRLLLQGDLLGTVMQDLRELIDFSDAGVVNRLGHHPLPHGLCGSRQKLKALSQTPSQQHGGNRPQNQGRGHPSQRCVARMLRLGREIFLRHGNDQRKIQAIFIAERLHRNQQRIIAIAHPSRKANPILTRLRGRALTLRQSGPGMANHTAGAVSSGQAIQNRAVIPIQLIAARARHQKPFVIHDISNALLANRDQSQTVIELAQKQVHAKDPQHLSRSVQNGLSDRDDELTAGCGNIHRRTCALALLRSNRVPGALACIESLRFRRQGARAIARFNCLKIASPILARLLYTHAVVTLAAVGQRLHTHEAAAGCTHEHKRNGRMHANQGLSGRFKTHGVGQHLARAIQLTGSRIGLNQGTQDRVGYAKLTQRLRLHTLCRVCHDAL